MTCFHPRLSSWILGSNHVRLFVLRIRCLVRTSSERNVCFLFADLRRFIISQVKTALVFRADSLCIDH